VIARETVVTLKSGELVALRTPVAADARAMLHFIRELTHEAWRNLNFPPGHFLAMTDDDEARFLETMAADPRSFLVTAWLDGAPIGNASVHGRPIPFLHHSAELGIGVLAAWHGRGLGRALMEHLLAEAERIGVWNLTLRVRTYNEGAIALYEKLGFRKVGTLLAAADLGGELADELVYQRLGRRDV
jgi:RimJ/RimL family protein N-acetyltransferase